jgi:hypothetical protein
VVAAALRNAGIQVRDMSGGGSTNEISDLRMEAFVFCESNIEQQVPREYESSADVFVPCPGVEADKQKNEVRIT